MITNRKTFIFGLLLLLSFLAVFALIMSPVFGSGRNGLEYADDMFNSLSKGSAYFIPEEMEKAGKLTGTAIDVHLAAATREEAATWAKLYGTAGAQVDVTGTEVNIKGDLGVIFKAILVDCDAMYHNRDDTLRSSYGLSGREATYAWYNSLNSMKKQLEKQKMFAEASAVQSLVKKAVEPAYNYYGITAKSVADYKGIVFLLMSFYIIYTIWYGFAFYYLFDGLGITTTKAARKVEA